MDFEEFERRILSCRNAFRGVSDDTLYDAAERAVSKLGRWPHRNEMWAEVDAVKTERQLACPFKPWLEPECWANSATGVVEAQVSRRKVKCIRCRRFVGINSWAYFMPGAGVWIHPACWLRLKGLPADDAKAKAKEQRDRLKRLPQRKKRY